MEQKRHFKQRPAAGAVPWLAGLLGLAAACYPSGVDSTNDLNTVTTVYDTAFQAKGGFHALSTYSIPNATTANPQNCAIENLSDGGTADFTNPNLPTTICSTLVTQLNDLGYTLINAATGPGATPPDFVVTVGALSQSYTAYVSYPWYGYWGGYYPYYPWYGWGVYYPWVGYSYSYQVGTLVITMVTPDTDSTLPDGGRMDAVWVGALNGVISQGNLTPPIVAHGIEQAFTQSPYLGKQ